MLKRGPQLRRWLLSFGALGIAFAGALLLRFVPAAQGVGAVVTVLGLLCCALFALAGDFGAQHPFGPLLRQRFLALREHTQGWMLWLALAVAFKIPVPLWPDGFELLGLLSTAALFLSALSYATRHFGLAKALGMATLASGFGLGIELLGSKTGFPFGVYSYHAAPPPLLLGVPLIVPLGWFAFALSTTLLAGGRAWLAGLLMMCWDVGLEPLMTAQKYWLWNDPQPLWAGAPLQNFLGWWAVGSFIAWGMGRIANTTLGGTPPSVLSRPLPSFALAYPIETFFLPAGLLLIGRPLEAVVTLAAMLFGLLVLGLTAQPAAATDWPKK